MKKNLISILFLFFTLITFGQQKVSAKHKYGILKNKKLYPLKYGDTLISIDAEDTAPRSVFLKHKQTIKELLFTDYEQWTWLEMDGPNYFMTGSGSSGSGNPEGIDVFRKYSATNVFESSGFILYKDSIHNIVVFGDRSMHNGFYTLSDLNANTYELYKEPSDYSWGCCGEGQVFNVTANAIEVTYPTNDKNKTIAYSRIKKK